MNYLFLLTIACLLNVACGYIRQGHPKFSFKWFIWIHASIPILIYLRIYWHFSAWVIPFTLAFAILGQIVGSQIRRSKMTAEDFEDIQRIPIIPIPIENKFKDEEIEVVLMNMGGPKTNEDVKEFQNWLFEDPLLIRFPLSFILQKFFANILIFFRLNAVKKRYWEMGLKNGGSPIYPTTENQVKALRYELNRRGHHLDVSYSFNYSPPYPIDTILDLKQKNKKAILPLTLYPHYSKATTGSNLFYLKKMAQENFPTLSFINPPSYHLSEGYIQSFVDRIKETIKPGEHLEDFYLMFSAHGLPLYFLTEGDPYAFYISQTAAAILAKLNRDQNWCVCFQSAVGPFEWLKPSTDDMIKALARRGFKKIIAIPISFVGDHIETIIEIDVEYKEMAHKLGITDYRMSKAIESHPAFISALADTVEITLNNKYYDLERIKNPELETAKT